MESLDIKKSLEELKDLKTDAKKIAEKVDNSQFLRQTIFKNRLESLLTLINGNIEVYEKRLAKRNLRKKVNQAVADNTLKK